MPWSAPEAQPPNPDGYVAVFQSTLPDSAFGGGPFSIKVTIDWPVIGATEAEWDALFQSVVDTLSSSGAFTFSHAEKNGITTWPLTPTQP
jgi:hypothetical protein